MEMKGLLSLSTPHHPLFYLSLLDSALMDTRKCELLTLRAGRALIHGTESGESH
jgi:hypothetical protein